jgi:dimethylargininase
LIGDFGVQSRILCSGLAIGVQATAVRIFDFTDAIVRTPGRSVIRGILKNAHDVPEFERVVAEHAAYVEALRAAGLSVEVLPPLEEFPDSVFVEDPALVFSNGAIVLRPGTPTRAGEGVHMRPLLQRRFARVLELPPGRYADGGDVLTTPRGVFIGLSRRTDRHGADGLCDLLRELDLTAQTVEPPPGSLHLKSAVSILDEETLLTSAAIAGAGLFPSFRVLLPPAEESSAHALRVNDALFVPAHFPRTADLLSKRGYTVKSLQVSEIRKLDAGLPCLSLRWRAARRLDV